MRARTVGMSLADTHRSLPRLTECIREADERRLEARVRAQVELGVCEHCSSISVMVDAVSGVGLCGDHAAAFAYYGRALVPIEAVLPGRP